MILGNIFVWREKESMSFTNFSIAKQKIKHSDGMLQIVPNETS